MNGKRPQPEDDIESFSSDAENETGEQLRKYHHAERKLTNVSMQLETEEIPDNGDNNDDADDADADADAGAGAGVDADANANAGADADADADSKQNESQELIDSLLRILDTNADVDNPDGLSNNGDVLSNDDPEKRKKIRATTILPPKLGFGRDLTLYLNYEELQDLLSILRKCPREFKQCDDQKCYMLPSEFIFGLETVRQFARPRSLQSLGNIARVRVYASTPRTPIKALISTKTNASANANASTNASANASASVNASTSANTSSNLEMQVRAKDDKKDQAKEKTRGQQYELIVQSFEDEQQYLFTTIQLDQMEPQVAKQFLEYAGPVELYSKIRGDVPRLKPESSRPLKPTRHRLYDILKKMGNEFYATDDDVLDRLKGEKYSVRELFEEVR